MPEGVFVCVETLFKCVFCEADVLLWWLGASFCYFRLVDNTGGLTIAIEGAKVFIPTVTGQPHFTTTHSRQVDIQKESRI